MSDIVIGVFLSLKRNSHSVNEEKGPEKLCNFFTKYTKEDLN